MPRKKESPNKASDHQARTPEPADRPVRIDEYVDDAYDERELDALDVPYALRSDAVLSDVADDGDGIEEIDVHAVSGEETVDTGMRRHTHDEANMGLGTEAHSADELEDAAIGHQLPGARGVTRDNEVHGRGLMDEAYDEGVDSNHDELR